MQRETTLETRLSLVVWITFVFSDNSYKCLSSFDGQWTSVSALNIQKVPTLC